MTALEIDNLRFRYDGAADWTVNIPRLSLARGEQMLLTGSSGRGKSTLLHLIAGLVDPHEGSIVIDGQSMGRSARPSSRPVPRLAHRHDLPDVQPPAWLQAPRRT